MFVIFISLGMNYNQNYEDFWNDNLFEKKIVE